MTLKGKKAIVTGGSRGIGAAIARRLAEEGADVAITYAGNLEAAEKTKGAVEQQGVRGFVFQADAGQPESQRAGIIAAAEALGGVDILVHNAGIAELAPLEAESEEAFDRLYAVNVKGLHVGTQAALPHLAEGGRVILIGSNSADKGFAALGTYASTKAAVASLARSWALELAPRRILVNTVQPGPIATDMNPADGEIAQQMKPLIPLGRYGEAEEIAGVVTFLAGKDAAFITGTTITADGGMTV